MYPIAHSHITCNWRKATSKPYTKRKGNDFTQKGANMTINRP